MATKAAISPPGSAKRPSTILRPGIASKKISGRSGIPSQPIVDNTIAAMAAERAWFSFGDIKIDPVPWWGRPEDLFFLEVAARTEDITIGRGLGVERSGVPRRRWAYTKLLRNGVCSCMGRTNIEIDETLVRKARKLTGLTTKREIVDRALELLVRSESRKVILSYFGAGIWKGDLKAMRRKRG